jgi:hypothetical protein
VTIIDSRVTSGVPQPWQEVVGGGGIDITTATYDSAGRVATYVAHNRTWTLAYLNDGRPDTESSGGLTRQYTYDAAGRFTGLTGTGATTGNVRQGTWAQRPTSGFDGDTYFATDVGQYGTRFKWNSALGRLVIDGPQVVASRTGNLAAPASNTLNNSNGSGSTLFTLNGGGQLLPSLPANVLYDGARLRLSLHSRRTGTGATQTIYWKIGVNGTIADASIQSFGMTAVDNAGTRAAIDLVFAGGKLQSSGNIGIGPATPSSTDVNTGGDLTVNYTVANILSLGCVAVSGSDTVYLLDVLLEWVS